MYGEKIKFLSGFNGLKNVLIWVKDHLQKLYANGRPAKKRV